MAKTAVRVLSAEAGPLAQMDVAWTGARSARGFGAQVLIAGFGFLKWLPRGGG